MTNSTAMAILLLGVCSCQANDPAPSDGPVKAALPWDIARTKRAAVVLRVERIAALGADKYGWDEVSTLQVLKNDTPHTFAEVLRVAHYSWKAGVPAGVSTIYLEPYANPATNTWRLLDADGAVGVSHAAGLP